MREQDIQALHERTSGGRFDPVVPNAGRPVTAGGPNLQAVVDAADTDRSRSSLAKSAFDRCAALLGLILLSPLLLMVAGLIYIRDPGPVLFAHSRIGKDGKSFRCYKFRTMAMDGDALLERHLAIDSHAAREWQDTRKLKSDPRVTPLGEVLRKASIDELPQLINILRGEMSVVGPRPIVIEEAHHYGPAIMDYLSVRPGLTGLWQVSGRNDVGYRERVHLDQMYVRNRSFLGDMQIILRTVRVVLLQKGSY
jgi:exopolysaccharide production protein ExoY